MRRKSALGPAAVMAFLAASILLFGAYSAHALYDVSDTGAWPADWPKEMGTLRGQSRTLRHSQRGYIHVIPFTSREEFEAAWPHILAVKSPHAPLTLKHGPDESLFRPLKAGVRILAPLTGTLVTPKGSHYPPGAESAVPDGKFLRIGPPWPDDLKSESGGLPEYAEYGNGKWVPFDPQAKRAAPREITRARTEIDLIVDGQIVDLNRIRLPPDTPIIDERFQEKPGKADGGGK